jgi:hypothetical protein
MIFGVAEKPYIAQLAQSLARGSLVLTPAEALVAVSFALSS